MTVERMVEDSDMCVEAVSQGESCSELAWTHNPVWPEQPPLIDNKKGSRSVRFNEEKQYFSADGYVLDEDTRQMLWYSQHDYRYFRTALWESSQALIQSAPEHLSKMWVETLAATYKSKITVSTLPQRMLAEVYIQADDLVGLERYVLNSSCRADAYARKSALRGALRLTKTTSSASSASKGRHLSVLSRRLSQTSQRFAQEIASAQSQALSWVL